MQPVETSEDDIAAILFTSGSTGVPKGAVYTHGNFLAQVELLKETYGIEPGEIDLPTFPLFALFDPALGMSAVIPEMDPTRPANVDPEKILGAIQRYGVTNTFGSPALLHRVGSYGAAHGVKLPTLRRVISAGAPAQPAGFNPMGTGPEDRAAASLISYLGVNQPSALSHFPGLRSYQLADTMVLDESTRTHLELFENNLERGRSGTLIELLDHSVTPLGARRIAQWLRYPLLRPSEIRERQEGVGALVELLRKAWYTESLGVQPLAAE